MSFKVPLQSEVEVYIKDKKKWPDEFVKYYTERFWNFYQSNGWKVSGKSPMKDWKAAFNSQWQTLKFKEDIEMYNKVTGGKNGQKKGNGNINSAKGFEGLDAFLESYKSNPTGMSFKDFGKFFDQLKEEKLLCQMDKAYTDHLLEIYEGDKYKCRCACVMKTMDMYVASGMRFSEILELRKKLA